MKKILTIMAAALVSLAAAAKDYSPELLQKAQGGNADAQFWVGISYYKGAGVAKDIAQAFQWMEKAAASGNGAAMNWMGYFYDNGVGTAKDPAKAIEYYQKGADKHDKSALLTLGIKYYKGEGVERNRIKAVRLFQRSADGDDNGARLWLGHCYEYGYGTPRNYSLALQTYNFGAQRLHEGCTEARDKLLERLKDLAYTDAEAAEGLATAHAQGWNRMNRKSDDTAIFYYKKAAEGGRTDSKANLGVCYVNGNGTTVNYPEALRWFRSAAADGSVASMFYLGMMHVNGYGTAADPAEGARWYRRAAELNADAMNNLGALYLQGNGVERDLFKAMDCYEKAMAGGNTNANGNLTALVQGLMRRQSDDHERAVAGYMYVAAKEPKKGLKMLEKASQKEPKALGYLASLYGNGLFIDKDYNKCVQYARQGAEQGDIMSHQIMGTLYYQGWGLPVDYRKAAEHWAAASAGGDVQAAYDLSVLYRLGHGVDKNPEKARELLDQALDRGSTNALVALAVLSYTGDGIPRDFDRAFKLLTRCSQLSGIMPAEILSEVARNLSACYRFGRGTAVNEELADYWMEISVQNGNSEAAGARSMFGISSRII